MFIKFCSLGPLTTNKQVQGFFCSVRCGRPKISGEGEGSADKKFPLSFLLFPHLPHDVMQYSGRSIWSTLKNYLYPVQISHFRWTLVVSIVLGIFSSGNYTAKLWLWATPLPVRSRTRSSWRSPSLEKSRGSIVLMPKFSGEIIFEQ